MNYSVRVGETVLSPSIYEGTVCCRPWMKCILQCQSTSHGPSSQELREASILMQPFRVLQKSEGRGTVGGWGGPIPEVCESPHTADVVRNHVAAFVAVECFGKFWEILKGA